MKKLLLFLVVSTFAFALASCEQLETRAVGFAVETLTLEVGESASLELDNPRDISLSDLTFASEDEAVVTVTSTGGVVAEGEGITAVTLTYEGVYVDFVLVSVFDPDGIAVDGREVVMRVANNYVQWSYEGSDDWTDLISLFALTGADGADGADGNNGTDGSSGTDGREVEFQTTDTDIEWRYVGDENWTVLLPLTLITGPAGEDGVSVVDAYFTCDASSDEFTFTGYTDNLEEQFLDGNAVTVPAGSTNVYVELEVSDPSVDYDLGFYSYFTDYESGELDSTEFDVDGNIIEYLAESTDDYSVYYSGYGGSDGDFVHPYGYEYFRIEGTTLEDFVFGITYMDDSDYDYTIRVLYNVNWSTFEPLSGPYNVQSACNSNESIFDVPNRLVYTLTPGFYDYDIYFEAEDDLNADYQLAVANSDGVIFRTYNVFDAFAGNYFDADGDVTFFNDPEGAFVGYGQFNFIGDLYETLYLYILAPEDPASDLYFEVYDDDEGFTVFDMFYTYDDIAYQNANLRYPELDGMYYVEVLTLEPGAYDIFGLLLTGIFDDETNEFVENIDDFNYTLVFATRNEVFGYGDEFIDTDISNFLDGNGQFSTDACGSDCPGGELFNFTGELFETLYVYVISEDEMPLADFYFGEGFEDPTTISDEEIYFVEEFKQFSKYPNTYLNFELSDGSIISLNYSEMFENSGTYAQLMDYIDLQDNRLQTLIDNQAFFDAVQAMVDVRDQFMTYYYQLSVTANDYDYDYYYGLADEDIMYYANLLTQQYFYELSIALETSPYDANDMPIYEGLFYLSEGVTFDLFSNLDYLLYLAEELSYFNEDLHFQLELDYEYDAINVSGDILASEFVAPDAESFLPAGILAYEVITLQPGFYDNYGLYMDTATANLDMDILINYDTDDYVIYNTTVSDRMEEYVIGTGRLYHYQSPTDSGSASMSIEGVLDEAITIYFIVDDEATVSNVSYFFRNNQDYFAQYEDMILNDGPNYGLLEEMIYFEFNKPYIPASTFLDYIEYRANFDESSFFHYLNTYPLTDWVLGDSRDRYEYITTESLNALDFFVTISFDDPADNLYDIFEVVDYQGVYNYNTFNDVQYTMYADDWADGGYYGVYDTDLDYYRSYFFNDYNEYQFPIRNTFSTISIQDGVFDTFFSYGAYGIDEVEFNVPYGASFGLPNELYFYGDAPVFTYDDDGQDRYFRLNGYYQNDPLYDVALKHDKDEDTYRYWSFNGVYDNPMYDIDNEIFIYADWEELYRVRFFDSTDIQIGDSQYIQFLDGAFAPDYTPYIPDGYEFVEWDTAFDSVTMSIDVTLVVQLIEYDITYNLDGGTNDETNPATYNVEDPAITLAAPTKDGYSFDGWFTAATGGTQVTTIDTTLATDVTVYAQWTPVVYDITYNLDGGTNDAANPSTYTIEDATITFGAPTKVGYTFNGWFTAATGGTAVTEITSGSTGDVIVYAQWTINQYTLSFDLNGGDSAAIADITQDYDTAVTAPADPTRTGYDFMGWALSATGEPVLLPTNMPAEDVTYYAIWEIQSFTVTFLDYDGSTLKEETVDYLNAATAPTDPSRTGYTFIGWDTDFDSITAATTVTALYRAINYAVEIIINGPDNPTWSTSGRPNIDETFTLVITPNAGYEITDVLVTYLPDGATDPVAILVNFENGEYTFTMPANDVIVTITTALFEGANVPYQVRLSNGLGYDATSEIYSVHTEAALTAAFDAMAVADASVTQATVADYLANEPGATVSISVVVYLDGVFVGGAYNSGYVNSVDYNAILNALFTTDQSFDFAYINIQFFSNV